MADALASGHDRRLLRRRAMEHGARSLQGHGHIATVKAAIWRSSPEKVLGVRSALGADESRRAGGAVARPLPIGAMVRRSAAITTSSPAMLADKAYLGRPAAWMLHGADRRSRSRRRRRPFALDDFFVPFAKAANFPWKSHALWFYSQMVRWGQVAHTPENAPSRARRTGPTSTARRSSRSASPCRSPTPRSRARLHGPTPVGSAGAA